MVDIAGSGERQLGDLTAVLALQRRAEELSEVVTRSGREEQVSDEVAGAAVAAVRACLAAAARYNDDWPAAPLRLEPLAQPLVVRLLIFADFRAARGEHERAASVRAQVAELADRHLGLRAAAETAIDLGMREAAQGRFPEALLTLDRARRTLLDLGATASALTATLQLANVHEWLGDHERGLAAVREVAGRLAGIAGARPDDASLTRSLRAQIDAIRGGTAPADGGDAVENARIQQAFDQLLQAKGRLARLNGDADLAEKCFREVRPHLATAGGAAPGIDFHLARNLVEQGRLEEALVLLDRIAPQFDEPLLSARLPALRMVQADAALQRSEPGAAAGFARDGLARLVGRPDNDLAWKLRWREGRALVAAGRPAPALDAFMKGASAADELRKAPLGYRLDTTFFRDKARFFEQAVDLAVDLGEHEAAATLVEQVKSRALAAVLSVPAHRRGARSRDEVRFDELTTCLDALDFEIQMEGRSAGRGRRRWSVLYGREAVLERLRLSDSRWRSLSVPPLHAPAETARLVGRNDQAVLSLLYRPDRIIGVLYAGGRVRSAVTPLTEATRRIVEGNAENVRTGRNPRAYDVSVEAGLELTDLVPADLLTNSLGCASLIVVPHGPLHLLPWAALTSGGRRLFDLTRVGILPNVSSIHALTGTPAPRPAVALLGDPDYGGLPGVDRLLHAGPEIEDVAALHGDRLLTAPVTGAAATDEAFWRLCERDGTDAILHVASHAFAVAEAPLASGLLLAGSKVDAAGIARRRIPYPEVVLSACSTGWRPLTVGKLSLEGDDALGLTAAFLEAGARFVLVSIPEAPDRAIREFVTSWHRHRSAGASPLAATAAAQQDMASGRWPVWSWAGITAYGCA